MPNEIPNSAADRAKYIVEKIKAGAYQTRAALLGGSGSSDDPPARGKPAKPQPPAKPRISDEQHRASIDREKHRLAERKRALTEREREHAQHKKQAAALRQLRKIELDDPAEFVRLLSGGKPAALRTLFERSVQQQRDPAGWKARTDSERMKREVAELRDRYQHEEMTRRERAALSAEVEAFRRRSDVLMRVDGSELVGIVAGILDENPGAKPRDALEAIEQRLTEAAKRKPAPKPAPKATASAPKQKPKKQPDTNAARAFVERFRGKSGRVPF